VHARIHARAKNNKNNSLRSYFPVVVFIGKNDETGIFYSQKQIQTNVAGMDFYRRPNRFILLWEEHTLCNPSFLLNNKNGYRVEKILSHTGTQVVFQLPAGLATDECMLEVGVPLWRNKDVKTRTRMNRLTRYYLTSYTE
jgi:hypothetical protein